MIGIIKTQSTIHLVQLVGGEPFQRTLCSNRHESGSFDIAVW